VKALVATWLALLALALASFGASFADLGGAAAFGVAAGIAAGKILLVALVFMRVRRARSASLLAIAVAGAFVVSLCGLVAVEEATRGRQSEVAR
jgi:cytochrome c oxidase subunit 4